MHIRGVGNLLTHIAGCCKPVPGDAIIGYITVGRGVSVHRQDCSKILQLQYAEPERIIEVSWGDEQATPIRWKSKCWRTIVKGLLRDITQLLATERINVLAMNTLSDVENNTARMRLTVEITGLDALGRFARETQRHAQHHLREPRAEAKGGAVRAIKSKRTDVSTEQLLHVPDLLDVMARLRDPEHGCPWDVQQSFASIAPHTLEECYELVDAIERGDFPQMRDELGDVLFQVIFYAQLGREQGLFRFRRCRAQPRREITASASACLSRRETA